MNILAKNRSLETTEISFNEENLIEISFASNTPYLRQDQDYSYNEVLVISEDSVDWNRLVDQKCPLLLEHDVTKQIGVVEKAWIEAEKIRSLVRFSSNEKAQQILKDVKDGIRRNVSFGYLVKDYKVEQIAGNIDTVYVTKFEPYQVSIVSVPADPEVGFKRSLENKDTDNMNKEELKKEEEIAEIKEAPVAPEQPVEKPVAEPAPEAKVEPVETKEEKSCCEKKSCECEKEEIKAVDETDDILALGELSDEQDLAKEAISENRSLKEFKQMILDKKQKKLNVKEETKMDNKNFSITKAIRSIWKHDIDAKDEFQISNELTRGMKTDDDFAFKPMKRDLDGSALINTKYIPSEYTAMNRPQTTLQKTGYTDIPSDGGPISFAVQTSGVAGGMYSIDGELVAEDLAWTLKTLTPHKAGAVVVVPYSLILEGKPKIDAIVEADIVKALAEVKDKQALVGDGTGNNILGIYSTSGVNQIPLSTAFSLSGVTKMLSEIRKSNDFSENIKFVMNSDNYYTYATTLRDKSAKGEYLITDDGKMLGRYDVAINNQLASGQIIAGNFDELVVTDFGPITVKVDDITYIKKQAIQLVAHAEFDCGVRKPKSFTITK